MKESTKKYLCGGAVFAGGIAKELALAALNGGRPSSTAVAGRMNTTRKAQRYFDEASDLRKAGK